MLTAETVTVTPLFGMNEGGDPIPPGTPVVLTPIAIAPGNTTFTFGEHGDQDVAEFTVYLSLSDESKVADGYGIRVRGRDCVARVRAWRAPASWPECTSGLEVLCHSATGKSA